VRLEIAVHDASLVSRNESGGGLESELVHPLEPLWIAGRMLLAPLRQRPAADVFHRDEDLSVFDPDIEDFDDVGMTQLRQSPRLPAQSARSVGARGTAQLLPQDLDRNFAVELGILRDVDSPHRALADAFDDLEATRSDRAGLPTKHLGLEYGLKSAGLDATIERRTVRSLAG
jgi:hypothetical protein